MQRFERRLSWWRSLNPFAVDAAVAMVLAAVGIVTVFMADVHDDAGLLRAGYREPSALAVVTVLAACAPIVVRRRWPVSSLTVASAAILVHFLVGWPQGILPLAAILLTYTVGASAPLAHAIAGLAIVSTTIVLLAVGGAPDIDTTDAIGVLAQYAAAWALGVAVRSRRAAADLLVHRADERAEAERQSTARILAEERLRIARELHDVVAHSMSVIAVQAGVGAHVLDERPEQARAVLETISATSRGTLTEMRRLLGALRDGDGVRSHLPAPGLADLPDLVADVQSAGVPVSLHLAGDIDGIPPGISLSAYRVVQEALTNVIKHAGTPSRVDVKVHRAADALDIEVVDNGDGPSATRAEGTSVDSSGHGLVGMRERVEVWGGELSVGPARSGGYRVAARIPCGAAR